jgi:hypothetical protein
VTNSCPQCGARVELDDRPVRLLNGTCAACNVTFTVLREEPTPTSGGTTVVPLPTRSVSSEVPFGGAPTSPSVIECADCRGPLLLRRTSQSSIEASCDDCRSTVTYTLNAPGAISGRAPRSDRGRIRERGQAFPSAAARPCRQCGGPLRFSTAPDGTVQGECGSCGNRFTLGPRREFGPRTPRSGERRGFGGFRRDGAAPRRRDRFGPRPRDRTPSRFRRRDRQDDEDEAPNQDRRRRRSQDE